MRESSHWARGLALAAALGVLASCAKKPHSAAGPSSSAVSAKVELPDPESLVAELSVPHPGASYRALRELGGPLAGLLPAGMPMLLANALALPPLVADSFDPELPLYGVLLQGSGPDPAWVLALHVVSGPELTAKLCTGNHAPFHALAAGPSGLQPLERAEPNPASKANLSLAVLDNYLLVASSSEALQAAGPFTTRTLPHRPAVSVPIALRFSGHALESKVVPVLRAVWAGYRTQLAHLDQANRSAHGGRAPDFADPAQVILGADAVVESLLSLLEGAERLELDLEPFPSRLDATLLLEPRANSDTQARLAGLALGDARALLTLPAETELAVGVWRSAEERELSGKSAGEAWVQLLGSRLSEREARQLRAALVDWELGRGQLTRYGFLAGNEPGAFLVSDVGDAARLKRAASELLGLLALPSLRAPLAQYLGQPQVLERAAPAGALAGATRRSLSFTKPADRHETAAVSFAWAVDAASGFASASKDADAVLKVVVQSARGERATLAGDAGLSDSVQRLGGRAALFAYVDAGSLIAAHDRARPPAAVFLALGRQEKSGFLQIEIAPSAIDLTLRAALGL